jgi:hypothetical protein
MFHWLICGIFRFNLVPAVCSGILCGYKGFNFLHCVYIRECCGGRQQFLLRVWRRNVCSVIFK